MRSARANRRASWRLRWPADVTFARYIRGRQGARSGGRSRSDLHQRHLSNIARLRAPAKRCGGSAAMVADIKERLSLGHHQFLERAMAYRAGVPVAEKPGLPLAVTGDDLRVHEVVRRIADIADFQNRGQVMPVTVEVLRRVLGGAALPIGNPFLMTDPEPLDVVRRPP